MIDINNLCFGQRYDSELGILEPWYTNPAMDRIKQMDLSGKVVLEYGGGSSSLWWERKAKEVWTIETKEEWVKHIDNELMGCQSSFGNLKIFYRPINEGDQEKVMEYISIPEGCDPDIIIADGIFRTEVCELAVEYFKKKGGGILIADNFDQDYIWISPRAVAAVEPFKKELYPQPNHTDHSGKCWKTLIVYIK